MILAALAAWPAVAQAGSASVETHYSGCCGSGVGYYTTIRIVSEPGEVNDVGVALAADRVVVTDHAARLQAGGGCRLGEGGSVECGWPAGWASLDVSLGDGADRLTIDGRSQLRITASGDGGDDHLRGSRLGPQSLSGGEGKDVLVGGGNQDELSGGPGRDRLDGAAGADLLHEGEDRLPDVLDGGAGRDRVSYASRLVPVRVDLPARRSSDGDRLRDIEDIFGGRARDMLIGDSGPNTIRAGLVGAGDRIHGGAGDDVLEGAGADVIRGGDGDDEISGSGRD